MNNRGDISILVLVILSVILFGYALYVFNLNSSQVISEIEDIKIMNSIYLKEKQIDFYVNEVIDAIFLEGYKDNKDFASKLRSNFKKYNIEEVLVRGELLKIAEDLDDNDVQMGDKIVIDIGVQIVDKPQTLILVYNYNKKFVR